LDLLVTVRKVDFFARGAAASSRAVKDSIWLSAGLQILVVTVLVETWRNGRLYIDNRGKVIASVQIFVFISFKFRLERDSAR
jgi:hypothetical protein